MKFLSEEVALAIININNVFNKISQKFNWKPRSNDLECKMQSEEQRLRDYETSIATIVHDLKTPIYACEKAVYLLAKERFGVINESQHKILKMCNNSLVFSKYLINNILCDYKNSQNNLSFVVEDFDLVALINDCVDELNIFAEEKALSFDVCIPEKLIISADMNEIKRVVLNLLYNAIAYSYVNKDIAILVIYNDDFITFSVKNEGNYIPPTYLREIFKKNISLDNKYNKMGTGLGLYLSKEIIVAHDGEMIAKSYPNNENIFGFKLKRNNTIPSFCKK